MTDRRAWMGGKGTYRSGDAAKQRKRGAFTLIELLVVIAIIMLLLSMLAPVMRRAKDLVKAFQCANNLRTFSHAFRYYQQDFNNFWPAPWPGPLGTGGRSGYWMWQWPYVISHYVRDDYPLIDGNPRSDGSKDMHHDTCPQAFCPVVHNDLNIWWWVGSPKENAMTSWSYAMIAESPIPWRGYNYVNTLLLTHASTTVHLSDFHKSYTEPFHNVWSTYDRSAPIDCHLGASNYSFCDGHVERLTFGQRTASMWEAYE
ncbi:MAG TPA: type II secretion system protein [Phycisphaerae bacterium]|nr:type II secretion system protein [Phycisphaerae bacterium]